MALGTRLYTVFCGIYQGSDATGNRYYEARRVSEVGRKRRRWVLYKGVPEPSKVPAEWHGWLHYRTDVVPQGTKKAYKWQRPHEPNWTGTSRAYFPKGHVLSGGKRAETSADYEPWQPPK